jgi:hypothetical protein
MGSRPFVAFGKYSIEWYDYWLIGKGLERRRSLGLLKAVEFDSRG